MEEIFEKTVEEALAGFLLFVAHSSWSIVTMKSKNDKTIYFLTFHCVAILVLREDWKEVMLFLYW